MIFHIPLLYSKIQTIHILRGRKEEPGILVNPVTHSNLVELGLGS